MASHLLWAADRLWLPPSGACGDEAAEAARGQPFDLERGVRVVELMRKAVGEVVTLEDALAPVRALYEAWLHTLHSKILVGVYRTAGEFGEDIVAVNSHGMFHAAVLAAGGRQDAATPPHTCALAAASPPPVPDALRSVCRTMALALPQVLQAAYPEALADHAYHAAGIVPPSGEQVSATPRPIDAALMADIHGRMKRDTGEAFCSSACPPGGGALVLQQVFLDVVRQRVRGGQYRTERDYLLDVEDVYRNALTVATAAGAPTAVAQRELDGVARQLGHLPTPFHTDGTSSMSAGDTARCHAVLDALAALDTKHRLSTPPPMAGVPGVGGRPYCGDVHTYRVKLDRGAWRTPSAFAEDVATAVEHYAAAAAAEDAPDLGYYCELCVRLPSLLAQHGVARL
eukprot:TRINITY_DN27894_c0_g1_i1.p1 TRINITY_DN27894_c0_g1~~TRINITY_DN27894_c0_g1_i1.p1  ORF type:complete len:400 (+),score=105.39 TRINITY_DN27894_c0_g1_i1:76-1275(+)